MRGIDGAFAVLERTARGGFASEALRRVWADIESPQERVLAASLTYTALRKLGLWRSVVSRYCKRSPEAIHERTKRAMIIGAAGIIGLRNFDPAPLINALVQIVKNDAASSSDAPLVNAVLRAILRDGVLYMHTLERSTELRDASLLHGVPGWASAILASDMGMSDARRVIRMMDSDAFASIRCASDHAGQIASSLEDAEIVDMGHGASSVRLRRTMHPYDIPGYSDGMSTVMSESSMWAVEAVVERVMSARHHDGPIRVLDMCMGRAVKSAQVLKSAEGVVVEGWERSSKRAEAAKKEFKRIGVSDRASVVCGNALDLVPSNSPDIVIIDAPCSGSGTWRRHPEAKWRLTQKNIAESAALQSRLFARASELAPVGSVVIYCTCSVFRAENEAVVGSVLATCGDLVELPAPRSIMRSVAKGRPYGSIVLPEDPWQDGFYMAIFQKKG